MPSSIAARLTHAPGATDAYSWGDKSLAFRRCATCGCVTHWECITDPPVDRMGVNARLADAKTLAGIELRYPDGQAWSGQGGFGYVREARIIGDET